MGYFNFTHLPGIWRTRNDKNPAHMSEETYREWCESPPGIISLRNTKDPDQFQYDWRIDASAVARRHGFLDGVLWALKVVTGLTITASIVYIYAVGQ